MFIVLHNTGLHRTMQPLPAGSLALIVINRNGQQKEGLDYLRVGNSSSKQYHVVVLALTSRVSEGRGEEGTGLTSTSSHC